MPSPISTTLLTLPSEIIDQILALLPPSALLHLSLTCRLLRSHSENDLLWAGFVKDNVPNHHQLLSPWPCDTWKDLYIAHHPYWFLPRHKIWFSNKAHTGSSMTGNLIIARYDPRRGCIEAYRLVAAHGRHRFELWSWNQDVIIHTFNPEVRLWLDDPVVKLDLDSYQPGSRLRKETLMDTGVAQRIHSMISLSLPIPPQLQHPSMALWPPSILPAMHRVRSDSGNMFRGDEHKPSTITEASDTTFRIRKWMDFGGYIGSTFGVRMGEDVMTFSTLPEESYMPAKEKPWQGIWVGDYSGHGCEFLVLLQKDATPDTIPQQSHPLQTVMQLDLHANTELAQNDWAQILAPSNASTAAEASSNLSDGISTGEAVEQREELFCQGRLEAIKLTGDPNVPRGEYTWIAEDIGPRGLVRVADEQMFRGARIVKSWGHIAANNFRTDTYIPSQLIMISHDSLAHYWEEMGHISFYSRVNIDDYLNV